MGNSSWSFLIYKFNFTILSETNPTAAMKFLTITIFTVLMVCQLSTCFPMLQMLQLPQLGGIIPQPWTPIETFTSQINKPTGSASSGLYLASFDPLSFLNKGK